jgi:protein-tyrosine phosphatase
VTLYGHARPFGYYVREQRFGIVDAELDPLSIPEIIQLSEWLYSEWKLGKRVAGKCQQGWNRSSLIVALVLMKDGMTANDAIALIREKRSKNALCNPHFVKFLKDYERGNLERAS